MSVTAPGQSRGQRIDEVRSQATTHRDGGSFVAHDIDADAEADEASAAFGEPIFIQPYDLLLLMLSYTAGTATDGVMIVAEVSEHKNAEGAPGGPWKVLYVQDPSTLMLSRWSANLTSTGDEAIAFSTPTYGAKWIRFKAWAPGTDQSDSRIELRAIPDKLSK